MTTLTLETLVPAVLTCATALYVAYLHRRQMRQAELYRKGESPSVHPPANPAAAFLRKNWFTITSMVVLTASLIFQMNETGPLTRGDVLGISSTVAVMVFSIVTWMFRWLSDLFRDFTAFSGNAFSDMIHSMGENMEMTSNTMRLLKRFEECQRERSDA